MMMIFGLLVSLNVVWKNYDCSNISTINPQKHLGTSWTLEMVYAIVNELDFTKTLAKPDSERIPFIE